jgi:hypothetical protein
MGSPLPGYRKRIGVCVLVECGSLREVHLLLRGVLQTRHQVTVARYAITDPMPVRLPGPRWILKIRARGLVPVSPMASSLSR